MPGGRRVLDPPQAPARIEGRVSRSRPRASPSAGSSGKHRTPSQPTAAPQWPRRPTVDVHDPDGVRLQKLLAPPASARVGSART